MFYFSSFRKVFKHKMYDVPIFKINITLFPKILIIDHPYCTVMKFTDYIIFTNVKRFKCLF